MEAVYRYCDEQIKIASPGTVESGQIVQTPDGRAGVVQGLNPETTGGTVSLAVEGVFDVLCAAATEFAAGQTVYWDSSANLAVTAPEAGEDFYVGVALAASSSTQAFVRVALNVPVSGGLGGFIVTPAVVVDHAEASKLTLLPAALNAGGATVLAFWGEVTEQSAGASEDQLIVGLYEQDEGTAKSTITAANASGDAIGDVVKGTGCALNATDGAVLAKVAAGKAVQVGVSQATSGSGLAGKFKVQALLALR